MRVWKIRVSPFSCAPSSFTRCDGQCDGSQGKSVYLQSKGKASIFRVRAFLGGRDLSVGWGFRQAGPLQLILSEFNIEKQFNDSESLHLLITMCLKQEA